MKRLLRGTLLAIVLVMWVGGAGVPSLAAQVTKPVTTAGEVLPPIPPDNSSLGNLL